MPFTLDVSLNDLPGGLVRIHLLGVFALYAAKAEEAFGTIGASVQLVGDRDPVFRQDLLNGRHYTDAHDLKPQSALIGDGSSLETVGLVQLGPGEARVDLLTIDVPEGTRATNLRFRDLGSPASFILFDVFLETEETQGCPFRESGGGISLAEIGSIVRVGDRVKFQRALSQMERSVLIADDLDEARGQALTFLALVTSATLEMGGGREMHRIQLDAAREMDRIEDRDGIAGTARKFIETVADGLLKDHQGPSMHLVDRALAIVERNFAKDISDSSVAMQLGLSTSHFRYLFRQATGQPFHKYLVALRLEKARQILIDQEMAVSAVAKAVGFAGLSHFSRAFTQRFSVSPTNIRRSPD